MLHCDKDSPLGDGPRPYLESLRKLLDELVEDKKLFGAKVIDNGICVSVEWPDATFVRRLDVLVVIEQGIYEFKCNGPEMESAGCLPLAVEKSIERIADIAICFSWRNSLESDIRNHALSDEPQAEPTDEESDVLDTIMDAIIAHTDAGPPCPGFLRFEDVGGVDKLTTMVERPNGGGMEFEVVFYVEEGVLVTQFVHHGFDTETGEWDGAEPEQWRREFPLDGDLAEAAISAMTEAWEAVGLSVERDSGWTPLDDMPDAVIAEAARLARLKRGKAE